MGVVRLNEILKIGLGVPDIEDTYDLCKSAEGDTYYLWLRVRRNGFVTALEDSNRYAGEDRVLVRGGWEFGEAEPSTTVRVPQKIGIPPSKDRSLFGLQFYSSICQTNNLLFPSVYADFRQKREVAKKNCWKVNTD